MPTEGELREAGEEIEIFFDGAWIRFPDGWSDENIWLYAPEGATQRAVMPDNRLIFFVPGSGWEDVNGVSVSTPEQEAVWTPEQEAEARRFARRAELERGERSVGEVSGQVGGTDEISDADLFGKPPSVGFLSNAFENIAKRPPNTEEVRRLQIISEEDISSSDAIRQAEKLAEAAVPGGYPTEAILTGPEAMALGASEGERVIVTRNPDGSIRNVQFGDVPGAPGAFDFERRLVEARRATEIAKKTRSAEEQFDAALDAGDLDKARMVRNFLDEPSEWQIELLKMQYADNLPALKILFDYVDAIGRADVVPEDARALVEGSTIYNPQTRQFEPFSQLGRPGEAPSALGQLKEIDPARAEAAQRIVDPGAFTFGAPPFLGGAALPGEAPEEASERMFSRAMQESARTGGLGREGARFAAEEDILDPGYFSRRIPGVTPTEVRAREQEAAALGRPVTAPVPVGPEEPATRRPVPQVTPEEFRAQEAQAAALGRPVAAPPPERIPAVMPETFRDREAEAAALGRMVTGPPADRFAPEEEVRRRREAFMAQFRENALAQAAAGYQATPATFQPRGQGEIVGSYFNTIPIEDQLRYHKMVETPAGMRSEYEPQFRGTPSRGMAQLVNLQGDVTYVNASDPDSMKYYQDQGYTVRSIGPSLIGPSLPEPGPSRAEREASFIKEAQAFAPKKKTPRPFGPPRFVTS